MVKIKKGLKKKLKKALKPHTKWWLWCPRPTQGGINLIRALGGKRIKPEGNRFKPRPWKIPINWGSTAFDFVGNCLNHPEHVQTCIDKLLFFETVSATCHQYIPRHTENKETAEKWVQRGDTVVCRTIVNGHSGQGIVIAAPKGKHPVVDAPLYTLYIPKDEEYRIHCIRHEENDGNKAVVFYSQKKVKRANFQGKHNRFVRCFDNGYTYQHDGIELPRCVTEAAREVFNATGLDFGAVDIIFCKRENKAYVLEINTAPGLEGKSVEAYATAFQKYF